MRLKTLFVAIFLIINVNAQDLDWSFESMCKFYKGEGYKARTGGSKAMVGDVCKFKFPYATDNKESARSYCEEHVPYHIQAAGFGPETTCSAEATLICASGWVQFFGRCYKMTKELMTHEQAVNHCAKQEQKSTIAFMHREALPFRINDYFTGVSQLWLEASIAITQDLIYNVEGGHLLLALDGYPYNLPNIALARVAPTERAMVLCEYTPRMNQAESNYLLRRYGEIYYPTIFTSDSAYVRTASVLQRNDKDPLRDNRYCKHVLRPFLQTDNAQAAVPTREFLDALKKERVAEIIRTSVYSGDSKVTSRSNSKCSASNSRNYGMSFPRSGGNPLFKSMKDDKIWRKEEPKEVCDGASWSTGIVLSRSSDFGLEAMSDARAAPLYCQTSFDVFEYGRCDSDWITFYRKETGQKYCHRFFSETATYEEAEAKCQEHGAHISGWTGQGELDILDKMLDEAKRKGVVFQKGANVWIGARRRPSCSRLGIEGQKGGFNPDPTHPCSRLRVFEWVHGVAQNPPDFENRWVADIEPNFVGDDEKCVTLLKGVKNEWQWPKDVLGDKKLNDITCDFNLYYFCGREAPIVKIDA